MIDTLLQQLAPDLRNLVALVLAQRRDAVWIVDPGVLAHTLRVDAWLPEVELAEAERELLRLHRVELAFLLREAAELRRELDHCSHRESRPCAMPLAAWRVSFREALRCAMLDGTRVSPELFALLLRCRARRIELWPSAVELARAALALHDVAPAHARLGSALLAERRAPEACVAFAVACARAPSGDDRQRALAELAVARDLMSAEAL